MAAEQNKKLIQKLFSEVMTGKNLSIADEIFAPGFINHGIPNAKKGPDGFKEVLQQFFDAYPDMKINVEHIIADDNNMVATRGHWTGTNKGSFMGMPASSKTVRVEFIDVWKIENGKLAENWVQMDMVGMMQQTGMMPAPATA